MKRFFVLKTAMLLLLGAVISTSLFAQETKAQQKADKTARIKSLIDSQNYVFVAQNALPMSGRMRNLTSEYNVVVGADSVISYLPYFGRAYTSVDYGATKSPLDFKTKSFDYNITPGKKDGWNITIKPKDHRSVQSFNLSVSSEGYASLQVTSSDRSPISFNGYIAEQKTKKKK
ncbi:DUF4251 domain-containing protein [Chitinophaga sp. OAE865]|uniref:DUF4251 domain-containing protein n=1 Tax=Chitinophaga sp. OAE865 TaxID=2817898 RepID=UPI001AE84443